MPTDPARRSPDAAKPAARRRLPRFAVVCGATVLLAAAAVTAELRTADAAGTGLPAGRVLTAGQSAVSDDGDYELVMKDDGNLAEYSLHGVSPIYQEVDDPYGNAYFGGGNAENGILVGDDRQLLWETGTAGHPGARAIMQDDGNLVVYSADGGVLWASGTEGHPGARLEVQSDANVVVHDADGRPLWSNNRVSTTDSGDSGPTTFRNCGTVAGSAQCGIAGYLPNGTGVTMKCWLSSSHPSWAHLSTDKWFYVDAHTGPEHRYGFVNAAYVTHQIRTPECVPPAGLGQGPPPAASVTPGTPEPHAASASAAAPPPAPVTTPPAAPAATASPETPADPPRPSAPTDPPSASSPRSRPEQSGSHGSPTFTDPYHASGAGPRIAAMATVDVSCRVYAPQIASANPDGWWYRIASSPWNNAYYAVANTFWNGDVPGHRPYTHNTDSSVPVC
ncbi:hypothetical protein [Streptomyces sp. NPDC047869]|uniref:hypothetical protein n=1 Tax=Streptomyces sp. NPDC047869 TaxID=3154709 RepID=UPI003452AE6D